jgi:NTP pyrophosphatase (non-canonical NTP hydrolase)
MKLTNEFEPIREWAKDKGIYEKGDPKTQYIKLLEEIGELAQSILKNDSEEFMDAIGDCVVVLTNLAALNDVKIEDCINGSYNVIAKRKGRMVNGTFVKEQ